MAQTLERPRKFTKEEIQESNAWIYEKFASDRSTDHEVKEAADSISDFLRTKLREDGFYRKLFPFESCENGDLDRSFDSEVLMRIEEIEPDSPGAISVPFNQLPSMLYMRSERYPIYFQRIQTRKYWRDTDTLRTWKSDLRQIFSDNALKDLQAEEDSKLLRAVNTAIVGPNLVTPTSGCIQYEVMSGGSITNDFWVDLTKVLPNTPSSFETQTVLMNNITVKDFAKMGHPEIGSLVEGIATDGWTYKKWMGVDIFITIKKGLVPYNTFYLFAGADKIGKAYSFYDPVMYARREGPMIEFYHYELIGGGIGYTSGLGRIDLE